MHGQRIPTHRSGQMKRKKTSQSRLSPQLYLRRLNAGRLELRGPDDGRSLPPPAPSTPAGPGAFRFTGTRGARGRPPAATGARAGGITDIRRDVGGPPSAAIGPESPWPESVPPPPLPLTTFRRAPPRPRAAVSTELTLAAKRSAQRLSYALGGSGLMLTNISVLPSPPRAGCRRYVSFELRYGM